MCETYSALPDVDKFEIPCAPNLGNIYYIKHVFKSVCWCLRILQGRSLSGQQYRAVQLEHHGEDPQ